MFALARQEAKNGGWEECRRYAYFSTLFLLGGRSGEIQRLEVDDFNPKFQTITIHAKWIPVGKRRVWWNPKTLEAGRNQDQGGTLPIGNELAKILREWIPMTKCEWLFPGKKRRGPWTCGGPGVSPLDQIKALGARAGVENLCQKSGRKGIGTHAKLIGLGDLERQGYFRHTTPEMGEEYDDEKVESMKPAGKKIETFYLFG